MTNIPQDRYWLVARDKAGLLERMMRFLAGDAHISFEGFLAECPFPASLSRTTDENSILQRSTLIPRLDFVILPLEQDTIAPILEAVLPNDRYLKHIVHIQIEQHRVLQFGCYDRFHNQCIVCFQGVPIAFLEELKSTGIIKTWTRPYNGAVRWHG